MRCKNCGWPNKPGATVCCKCKSKLDNEGTQFDMSAGEQQNESPANLASGNATIQQPDHDSEAKTVLNIPAADDGGHMPTVVEGQPNEVTGGWMQQPVGSQEESPATRPEFVSPDECPQCHYPLRPNTRRCPNCQAVIWSVGSSESESTSSDSGSSTVMINPHDAQKPRAAEDDSFGTVNPYMKPKPRAEFSLELIPGQGEQLRERQHNYQGEEVVLNRSNTESTNNTITGKVQAVVKFDGERWTIEDRSSLRTTYVRAGRPIELREGDIILLGDRQFIFHVDQ